MNFFPDFAPNSRKEWRLLLFQSNLRKQFRKLPKFWNLWELLTIIQNYSLVSLVTHLRSLPTAALRRLLCFVSPKSGFPLFIEDGCPFRGIFRIWVRRKASWSGKLSWKQNCVMTHATCWANCSAAWETLRDRKVQNTWGICARRAGKLYKARSRLYRSQI